MHLLSSVWLCFYCNYNILSVRKYGRIKLLPAAIGMTPVIILFLNFSYLVFVQAPEALT